MLNLSSARVVDPILTTIAQGFAQQPYALDPLFPTVPVPMRAGKVIEFGKEAFRIPNSKRAPGTETSRIQISYQGRSYTLEQHSIEGEVPMELAEEASASLGIDLQTATIRTVTAQMKNKLEADRAAIATAAASYGTANKLTLAGATKWSASTGTPMQDVATARQQIRKVTGAYPTHLFLSAQGLEDLRVNAQLRDYYKYTSNQFLTEELIAAALGVPKIVQVAAIQATGPSDTFSDIWGNFALLANCSNPAPLAGAAGSYLVPNYGYTYTLKNGLYSEQPYYDANHKTWYFPQTWERIPVVTGLGGGTILGGYLFTNPS